MFSSYYDWNNFATDKNPALTLFIVQNFPLPSFHSSFNIVKYTTNVAFRAKCKIFSRHLQKPILKTEKGRFKGL